MNSAQEISNGRSTSCVVDDYGWAPVDTSMTTYAPFALSGAVESVSVGTTSCAAGTAIGSGAGSSEAGWSFHLTDADGRGWTVGVVVADLPRIVDVGDAVSLSYEHLADGWVGWLDLRDAAGHTLVRIWQWSSGDPGPPPSFSPPTKPDGLLGLRPRAIRCVGDPPRDGAWTGFDLEVQTSAG